MQRTFWMIFLVFAAECCKSPFSKTFLRNYFQKSKNGQKFLSIFKNLPDLFSGIFIENIFYIKLFNPK